LLLRFDARNDLDRLPVLLIFDSVFLEVVFQRFNPLVKLVFCLFLILFLTVFLPGLLFQEEFFLIY
jgi:hypothetical protein